MQIKHPDHRYVMTLDIIASPYIVQYYILCTKTHCNMSFSCHATKEYWVAIRAQQRTIERTSDGFEQ